MKDIRAWSTALIFGLCGLVFGTWSASIPHVRTALALDEAQLGLLILFFSVGVIPGNPASVPAMQRFGIMGSAIGSVCISVLCFACAVSAWSVMATACFLVVGGFAFSILNVAMNSSASQFEVITGGRIMSKCHGMWSVGAMTGSAVCSAVSAGGIAPATWFLLGIGSITIGISLIAAKGLRAMRQAVQAAPNADAPSRRFQWPTALLWSLIILSMCTNLTEGTMADWAAIFMRDEVGAPLWLEGWGFGVYAFCMATTRFFGDGILAKYQPKTILYYGGLVCAAGLMLAVWTQSTVPTLIGFGMIGVGVALGAPILYGASARVAGMAPGAGLAVMNTFGMVGFLSGPAIIGFIARTTSLPMAFAVVAAVCLFWVWRSQHAKQLA
jgi:MFS family permease